MPIARIEALGLCEHCGELINITGMPTESLDAPWCCPSCKKELSHLSFGYDDPSGGRVRWVGLDGSWTAKRPIKDFSLRNLHVLAGPPPSFF